MLKDMRRGSDRAPERSQYGSTVRGQLLQVIHEVSVAGYPAGVARQLKTGTVDWKMNSVDGRRGVIGCASVIKGTFPQDFSIVEGWLNIDSDQTSLHVSRNMLASFNHDPYAHDFLEVVSAAYEAHEAEFCLAALRQAERQKESLVTLRAASTGEILAL